jgi:hypothetical protein
LGIKVGQHDLASALGERFTERFANSGRAASDYCHRTFKNAQRTN